MSGRFTLVMGEIGLMSHTGNNMIVGKNICQKS